MSLKKSKLYWLPIKYNYEQPEASYNFILNKLIEISGTENFYFKPVNPKLSDIELISLIILAEFKSIDSEYQLFREIKGWAI
ncbi:hypothetical protein ACQ1PV_10380, partial [Ornithobacterium rhinotracheale]